MSAPLGSHGGSKKTVTSTDGRGGGEALGTPVAVAKPVDGEVSARVGLPTDSAVPAEKLVKGHAVPAREVFVWFNYINRQCGYCVWKLEVVSIIAKWKCGVYRVRQLPRRREAETVMPAVAQYHLRQVESKRRRKSSRRRSEDGRGMVKDRVLRATGPRRG